MEIMIFIFAIIAAVASVVWNAKRKTPPPDKVEEADDEYEWFGDPHTSMSLKHTFSVRNINNE